MIPHDTLDRQSPGASTMGTTHSTETNNDHPPKQDEDHGVGNRNSDSPMPGTTSSTLTIGENQTIISPTTTAHSAVTTTDCHWMKLIVRSQYWGRELKGKTFRDPLNGARPYRVISGQAVRYRTDEYWGCCPHHGKRVLEMQDCHFADSAPYQNWDLFLVERWVSESHEVHNYFLLPQNQNIIDLSLKVLHGWLYVGTARAGSVRTDLEEMFRVPLECNDQYGYRHHHVHLDIMMDKVSDRDSPRTRKVNNERAREDRRSAHPSQQQQQAPTHESSESATDDTTTTTTTERDGPPSVGNLDVHRSHPRKNGPFVNRGTAAAPPIPNVVSNDSSMFSHSVASTTAMSSYHDGPLSCWGGGTGEAAAYWSTAALSPPHHSHGHGRRMDGGGRTGGTMGPNSSASEYLQAGMNWFPGNIQPYQNLMPPVFNPAVPAASPQHQAHQWQHGPAMHPYVSTSHCHPQQTQSSLFPQVEQYVPYQEALVAIPLDGVTPHGSSKDQSYYSNYFLPLTGAGPPPRYGHCEHQQGRHHMKVPREILSHPVTSSTSSAISTTSVLSTSGVSTTTARTEARSHQAGVVGMASSGAEGSRPSCARAADAGGTGNPPSPTAAAAATYPGWAKSRTAGSTPRRSEEANGG